MLWSSVPIKKKNTNSGKSLTSVSGEQSKIEGLDKTVEVQQGPGQGLVQAHGVGLDSGLEDDIFLSANLSVVETHRGSDVTLNCRVKRNSDYGTVRISSNNPSSCHLVICCCR